jgi:hypothetical protein
MSGSSETSMPSVSEVGRNSSFFCASLLSCDGDDAEIDDAARVRPGLGRVARGIAGTSLLHLEMERHRAALQPLGKLGREEVRRAFGGIGRRDVSLRERYWQTCMPRHPVNDAARPTVMAVTG